jgi:hypothetical protein
MSTVSSSSIPSLTLGRRGRIPARVYLRLKVRDSADNAAVAQTPDPILVDLHTPEVQSLKLIGDTSTGK